MNKGQITSFLSTIEIIAVTDCGELTTGFRKDIPGKPLLIFKEEDEEAALLCQKSMVGQIRRGTIELKSFIKTKI